MERRDQVTNLRNPHKKKKRGSHGRPPATCLSTSPPSSPDSPELAEPDSLFPSSATVTCGTTVASPLVKEVALARPFLSSQRGVHVEKGPPHLCVPSCPAERGYRIWCHDSHFTTPRTHHQQKPVGKESRAEGCRVVVPDDPAALLYQPWLFISGLSYLPVSAADCEAVTLRQSQPNQNLSLIHI